jgi:4-hydroxy-tetrahydrodipicolinate synthase
LSPRCFSDVNPIPVKQALKLYGLSGGPCRLPLDEMSEGGKNALYKTLKDYSLVG